MLVFEKFPFVDNFWLESQMDRSHLTIQSPMKSANSALRIFLQMQKLECSIYHNLFDNFYFYFYHFSFVLVLLGSHHVYGKKERKKSNWVAPRPHIIMIVADDLVRRS